MTEPCRVPSLRSLAGAAAVLLVVLVGSTACSSHAKPHAAPHTGRPSAATTGPLPGTKFTRHGELTVTKDGTTIQNVEVDNGLVVHANNVTIRNSIVRGAGYGALHLDPGFRNLVIENVEVAGKPAGNGQPGCGAGVSSANYTAIRVHVHGCEDGFRVGSNTTVKDCLVDDLLVRPQAHNDGIQALGGHHMLIEGNVIINKLKQTSAILLKADASDISDVVIRGNYLQGGSYTVYVRNANGNTATGVVVENNTFGPGQAYGLLSNDEPVDWHGNVWAGTKTPAVPHQKAPAG